MSINVEIQRVRNLFLVKAAFGYSRVTETIGCYEKYIDLNQKRSYLGEWLLSCRINLQSESDVCVQQFRNLFLDNLETDISSHIHAYKN